MVCGTIIPTNPIRPLTATTAAVPRDAANTDTSRTSRTSIPNDPASSSPTAKTSSLLLKSNKMKRQPPTYGETSITSSHPAVRNCPSTKK